MFHFLLVLGALLQDGVTLRSSETQHLADAVIVKAGEFQARSRAIPWSGSWWPMVSCELAQGWRGRPGFHYDEGTDKFVPDPTIPIPELSPLAKYDLWHFRRFGEDPHSVEMELRAHNIFGKDRERYDRWGKDYSWWGHCNGWAAASIMEREPFHPVVLEGVWFEAADLKGLLTESWSECETWMVGNRVRTEEGDLEDRYEDAEEMLEELGEGKVLEFAEYRRWYFETYGDLPEGTGATAEEMSGVLRRFMTWFRDKYPVHVEDVLPEDFHRLLVDVIGREGRGIVLDLDPGVQVWNTPAYGYGMEIREEGAEEKNGQRCRVFRVRVTLELVSDNVRVSSIGTERLERRYTYRLYCDESGRILRGRWIEGSQHNHPDFAWVPLHNHDAREYQENTRLSYGKLEEILATDHRSVEERSFDLEVRTGEQGVTGESRRSRSSSSFSQPLTVERPVRVRGLVRETPEELPVARVEYWLFQPIPEGSLYSPLLSSFRKVGESGDLTDDFEAAISWHEKGRVVLTAQAWSSEGRLLASDEITLQGR